MEIYVRHLPVSEEKLREYPNAQAANPTCSIITAYCQNQWPEKRNIPPTLKQHWVSRGELTMYQGLLLKGCRIVVPKSMQRQTLSKLHEGHQGIQTYHMRAKNFNMVARDTT
jgi:hypothetical protein